MNHKPSANSSFKQTKTNAFELLKEGIEKQVKIEPSSNKKLLRISSAESKNIKKRNHEEISTLQTQFFSPRLNPKGERIMKDL